MHIGYDVLPTILFEVLCFFFIYYLLCKGYIYSVLDPLFILIFTLSFSSVLVINILESDFSYLVHFFICQLSFFIGFICISRYLLNNGRDLKYGKVSKKLFFDYDILRNTTYILFGIYFLGNIITFYTTGFALLSEDPTLAKVENFSKGIGIIFIINLGVGSFLTASLIFYLLSEGRIVDFILLGILLLFTALEGSKGGLLRVLITLALLINHQLFAYRDKFIRKFKYIAPLGIGLMLVVVFTVLSKENVDSDATFFAFVRRLLYGADSILTFYLPVNQQYFSRYNFWDYPAHLFNQILAFLRIVPNNEAFGNVMVSNAFPDRTGTIIGPNTPFYIEGQIFFGYYGAFVYSAIIGCVYGFIRQYFFITRYQSAFWFVFICCTSQQAAFVFVEATFFTIQVFYTCFFVIPVYIIASLFFTGKIRIKKLSL